MGRVIKNVKIKESPEWLKTRIRAMGLNPINNVVDITNFVMFEYNQPMHAFDLDKVEGNITIRAAKENEEITTLDGVERVLKNGELVKQDICELNGTLKERRILNGDEMEYSTFYPNGNVKQKILASFLLFFRKLGINHRNGHNNTAEYFPNSQRLSQKQPSPYSRINGSGGHEKRSKSILQSLLRIALHGKGHCSGHDSGIRNGKESCLQTHKGELFKENKAQ